MLICIVLVCSAAAIATPTDLEADVAPVGRPDLLLDVSLHELHIEIAHQPEFFGDEVILQLTISEDVPMKILSIQWEYSKDCETWYIIPNEDKLTYKYILTRENQYYWYRAFLRYQILDID